MKTKRWAAAGVAVAAISTGAAVAIRSEPAAEYRTVVVDTGDIESVVTSTGRLQATETVEVGTQVSGQIAELLVDFNDRVTKGQLLARIDPAILRAEVRSAEAALQRSEAELEKAERALARSKELFAERLITESDHENAGYTHSVASASHVAAQISLERAQRNLAYTEIRAPIDGVVVERTVEVGQTVAASTSAPKLFVIARDLTELEILAAVDETDIGKIEEGQEVRFTVQAFGERKFTGTVVQVRLQSVAADNVVSYTVVVSVPNPDGALLPGMTATADFVLQRETGVLRVANTALRFRPPANESGASASAASSQTQRGGAGGRARGTGGAGGRLAGGSVGTLWAMGDDGLLRAISVRTGLTDGQYTAVSGEGLEEGMEVVAGLTTATATATASNPFQQPTSAGPTRPGGF